MKNLVLVALLILVMAGPAIGAQVYGVLRITNRSVGRGARVEVQCGNAGPGNGETDDYGAYKVFVRAKGKCLLRVFYAGRWLEAPIYSYDDPVRYDFDVVTENNQYKLRRR